jgi:hypothetical protein
MRHLWSLLAGLVVAPLAWLLLSTGQFRSVTTVAGWEETGRFDTVDLVAPAAFLAVAGALLGLLGTLRWSPAGPLAAGLLFIVPTILMFIDPFDTLDRFLRGEDGSPRRLFGQDLEPWLPVENGTLLVLGALLLMAVLSSQRWRRWPAPAPTTDAGSAAGATAPDRPHAGEERATPAAMSDDEILAEATAYEHQENTDPDTDPARTVAEEEGETAKRNS